MRTVFGKGDRDGKSSCLFSEADGKVQYSDRVRKPAVACAISRCSIAGMDGVGALTATHMLRRVSRLTELGAHHRLQSLDLFFFRRERLDPRSVCDLAVNDKDRASLKARLC